ncbi:hypothetical protein [Ktedonobacter robiniae]|uniref:hypothetical protein n=1 Tax=Ktedonobacter robiniae TaxID=2778365 RepID=UPI001914E12F|nr:hypothetical protein [Ktedonobacter robiniae]
MATQLWEKYRFSLTRVYFFLLLFLLLAISFLVSGFGTAFSPQELTLSNPNACMQQIEWEPHSIERICLDS